MDDLTLTKLLFPAHKSGIVTENINAATATNTFGTTISNNLVMNVSNAPGPTVAISLSTNNVCAGTEINASATALNSGANPNFEWFINETSAGGTGNFMSVNFENGDEIFCVLSPSLGACSLAQVHSDTLTLSILDTPQIEIIPVDTTIFSGSQIQLSASISSDVISYQWNPSNFLIDANAISPITKNLDDNMNFILSATGSNGCKSFAESSIKVLKNIYLPNAFTPNGDGLNDVFRVPPGLAFTLSEFSVYDRWGVRIFSSRNISEGWDGKVQGKAAAPGVYVYSIKGSDNKGTINLRGTITLIR